MATLDVKELALELGVPIDESNPLAAIKALVGTLKDKAANGEDMKQQLAAAQATADETKTKLEELLAMPALQVPQADPADRKVLRRAADSGAPWTETGIDQLLYGDPEVTPQKRMRLLNDAAYIMGAFRDKPAVAHDMFHRHLERDPALHQYVTGIGSDATGYGAEWGPTQFSADVWQDIYLQTLVGGNLQQIAMPSLAYKLPYKASSTTAYLTSQATDITTSRFGTEADTLTAVGFGAALYFSGEMEEDSIIPVMPLVRDDLARVLAEGLESALLNGDNAIPHQDSDVTGATDVRKAWDGFRQLSLAAAGTKYDGTGFAYTSWRGARAEMGKYGINPADLICVTGPVGWNKLLNLEQVITMDKYGANATLLTGEVARFDGVPIIVSGQIRETLNASGVYDGSTMTKTVMHLINKRCFMLGTRRQLRIEDQRFALGDYTVVVAKARWAFAPRIGVSATYPCAEIIYNV